MFDRELLDELKEVTGKLVASRGDLALATGDELRGAILELRQVIDSLEGVEADVLARIDESEACL